jgi:hypothetical protein
VIEPIAPIGAIKSPEPIQPPDALKLRPAMNGARRFIVQFHANTPLPEVDEIPCTAIALQGIIPDDVARSLTFSEATAWLCRLYPVQLAHFMDEQASALANESIWSDISRPGFSDYYLLRFTGGMDDGYITDALARASTIRSVQPEFEFVLTASAVTHADPEYVNQSYLKAAPKGISVESAWNEGAAGAAISIGFAEKGFLPSSHPDITISSALGQGAVFSEHMLNVSGILVAADNTIGIVGVAPQSKLIFSATDAIPAKNAPAKPANSRVPANVYTAIALLNSANALKAGDVLNFSIAADVEVDQNKSPKVAASLPVTVSNRRGTGSLKIAKRPNSTALVKASATIPIEFDPALLALMRQFSSRGITICMGAGNGYEATYLAGTTQVPNQNTGVGADISTHWLNEVHTLNRADATKFKDGGAIVVGGGVWVNSRNINQRILNFNFGNRIDCFAQGTDVATWATSNIVRAAGTSVATPIVAGAAALIQSYIAKNYQSTLKPLVLRAILSDPLLNTASQVGDQIGFMPDLAKIMPLLKTSPFDKVKLVAAIAANATTSQAAAAKAKSSASGAPPIWIHDPYTFWNETNKTWVAIPLTNEQEVFNP